MKRLAMPQEGTSAPDFSGKRIDGTTGRLSEYWGKKALVVVFLRHLGCTFCRQHVQQLGREHATFQRAGVEIVCVAMGDEKLGKAFTILFNLPFPLLMVGDDASAYLAYGLEKGSWLDVLGPRMLLQGVVAMFSLGSKTHGGMMGDGFRMSGTFLIDQSGTIRLAYRSKDAADNPPNSLLLQKLQEINAGGFSNDFVFPVQPQPDASI